MNLKPLLFASVSLNLLSGGVIIGALFSRPASHSPLAQPSASPAPSRNIAGTSQPPSTLPPASTPDTPAQPSFSHPHAPRPDVSRKSFIPPIAKTSDPSSPPSTSPSTSSQTISAGTASSSGESASPAASFPSSRLSSDPAPVSAAPAYGSGGGATGAPASPPTPQSVGTPGEDIDPASVGNYLSSDGQRVAVEDVTFNEDGTSSMDLSLTPEDSTPAVPATRKGYTYEEEMFRLKWGVSAYQHAKSLARSAASGN